MSKLPPYEERDRQWDDMPLPDADVAWQQMNALLDKEERRRPLLPPFLVSCAGIGLLAAALIGGGWWLLAGDRDDTVGRATPPAATVPAGTAPSTREPVDLPAAASNTPRTADAQNGSDGTPPPAAGSPVTKTPGTTGGTNNGTTNGSTPSATGTGTPTAGKSSEASRAATSGKPADGAHSNPTVTAMRSRVKSSSHPTGLLRSGRSSNDGSVARDPKRLVTKQGTPANAGTATMQDPTTPANAQATTGAPTNPQNLENPLSPAVRLPQDSVRKTTIATTAGPGSPAAGPATGKPADSLQSSDSSANPQNLQNPQNPKNPSSKPLILSAGVGLQQLLVVDGQQPTPYNYRGGSGFLSDHVPSVYLRAEKGRWFLQGEVKLSAPQLFRSFAYSQKTVYDTANAQLQVTRNRLRKAYYHQLPLTLNYRVWKGWSIGAGGMYSVFYRALSEQEISTRAITPGATVSSVTRRVPIPEYRDSFLLRSQVHLLLQTDYSWRRWSLGLRYKRDLQPFIRFTRPDGTVEDQHNHSLEAVLRFRLWQSKRR
ncbi:hypothetical protein [Flaviaesturariibacter amylovorans]|uniref:Outer membrane protein beta-barrel domain-containing protein n=1 Tax=Flaviaesturariibacter amylovorans TaxID=1084520 RepID=A0ABP8HQG5_9BACT